MFELGGDHKGRWLRVCGCVFFSLCVTPDLNVVVNVVVCTCKEKQNEGVHTTGSRKTGIPKKQIERKKERKTVAILYILNQKDLPITLLRVLQIPRPF